MLEITIQKRREREKSRVSGREKYQKGIDANHAPQKNIKNETARENEEPKSVVTHSPSYAF